MSELERHGIGKVCTKCGERKPLTQFSPNRRPKADGSPNYASRCKPCMAALSKEIRDRKREAMGRTKQCRQKEPPAVHIPPYIAAALYQPW